MELLLELSLALLAFGSFVVVAGIVTGIFLYCISYYQAEDVDPNDETFLK